MAFFDLNSFFASVEQQERPELRGRPVAVVPSATRSTCAIAASYEAKAHGIKTGTKIYEAKAMCPDLVCVLARHDAYVDYHHRVFTEVARHIPIEKVCSIDEGACRLMRGERDPEAATALAHQIKAGLRARVGEHITCSIGLAPNMFLAKVATGMQKPDGLVILPPQGYRERLFQLSLGSLHGIGRNMLARLNRAGVMTIADLWNLSPKHARKIWGNVAGEVLWYRLHGYDIPDAPTKKRLVSHSRVLDPNHRPNPQAYPIIQHLTQKAAARLRRYGFYARRLHLGVRFPKHIQRRKWAGDMTFAATQDTFAFLRALDSLWAVMSRETAEAPLLMVSVHLSDLCEAHTLTLDLFDQPAPAPKDAKNQSLSRALDALNTRYGRQAITIGPVPQTSAGYMGTKIAFNRVPEREEFWE